MADGPSSSSAPNGGGGSEDNGDDPPPGLLWKTLDISNMGIYNVASNVGIYKHLTTLLLNNNRLSVVRASVFAPLANLETLNLAHNIIQELDPDFGLLLSLKNLSLAYNHIGVIPLAIGRLFRLRALELTGNPVENIPHDLLSDGPAIVRYLRDMTPPSKAPKARQYVESGGSTAPAGSGNGGPGTALIMCYNILCEMYATAKMYRYTPNWALKWEYRRQLIMTQLVNSHADVICLQEVKAADFDDVFKSELRTYGYDGLFKVKSRAQTMRLDKAINVDGCAIFWQTARFRLRETRELQFDQLSMKKDDLRADEQAFSRLLSRDNIAVLVRLEELGDDGGPTGRELLVANTHIHFDPEYSDVKLVQVQLLLEETERMLSSMGPSATLAVCGDFNSLPTSGVYELLSRGRLAAEHPELKNYKYGLYSTEGMEHNLPISSAYATVLGDELAFTNFTPPFSGVIDYIWVSDGSVEAVLEGVSYPDAEAHVAMPSPHFPSDHISIAARIRLN